MGRQERRLAAILAADVAGYSRLMAADEAGTLARFSALRAELIDPKIGQFKGQVVGTAGDSLLVEFASAVDAVQCAVETQEQIAFRNAELPEDHRITFRMGVNLGDVISDGGTIHGDSVNVAARLEKMAGPGAVVVGRSIYDQVKGKVPYAFADLGEHAFKNIVEPVRVFGVATTNQPIESPATSEDLPLPSIPSVAVLPFTNMSGDLEQEYFSDGITEDIITELSRSQSLFVIARNSSFVFKGRAVDVTEVGRKLGVRYVVEGSVRKAGTRVRITAQLIEAPTGNHVWAERYDRDLADLFAVQDDVTERIVWALVGKVAVAEISRSRKGRKRIDAYDALLRGMDAMHRFTEQDAEVAIEFFKTAVSLEPDSARAHVWLAEAYSNVAGFGGGESANVLALQAARRAIQLGDVSGHAEALVAAHCGWKGDFEAAEAHLQRAFMLGPTSPDVLAWAGFVCLWQGQTAKAAEIGERLKRLDPLEPRYIHELLAFAHYLLGDYQASLDAFRRWNNENYARGFANLAACLAQVGRIDEAKVAWRRCLDAKQGFTIEDYKRGSPYRRQEDLAHWLDGLRKAGITE
jgi:TolB-like protein/Flp pilus assembly protein TadD